MGEDAGRRPKPVRVREANARILRAIYQPNMDAMFIEFQLAMPRANASPKPRRIELYAGRGRKENVAAAQVGRAFPMAAQAESTSRNPHSDWDVVSGWHIKRKLRPGILIRNGIHLPDDGLSGKYDPEFALRPGRAFPSTAPTP